MKRGFAIIRLDLFHEDIEHKVNLKRVMWDRDEAEKEIDRLNALNGHKGCKYILQLARVDN